MMVHGISPGPLLIQQDPKLFWGFIASMYVGNVILLILNLPLVGLFVNLLRVPYPLLYPVILVCSILGVYAVNSSVVDVWIMLAMGVLGYVLRKLDFETAPIVLGLVLAPMLELSLRQSLAMSGGRYAIFVTRPDLGDAARGRAPCSLLLALRPSISRTLDWRSRLPAESAIGAAGREIRDSAPRGRGPHGPVPRAGEFDSHGEHAGSLRREDPRLDHRGGAVRRRPARARLPARRVAALAARARAHPRHRRVRGAPGAGRRRRRSPPPISAPPAPPMPIYAPHPALPVPCHIRPLARGRVRFVGEPVAAVVADDPYRAHDALDLVRVEYEPLPALVDVEAALAPRRARASRRDRLATSPRSGASAWATPTPRSRGADVVVRTRIRLARGGAHPLEPRGLVVRWDGDRLTVWGAVQMVHRHRGVFAGQLGVPEEHVRVIAPPDVGGGFGTKGMYYPEYIVVAALARQLDRPIKWIETRREHTLVACVERDQVHDVEIARHARRPPPRAARRLPARHGRVHDLRPEPAPERDDPLGRPVRDPEPRPALPRRGHDDDAGRRVSRRGPAVRHRGDRARDGRARARARAWTRSSCAVATSIPAERIRT